MQNKGVYIAFFVDVLQHLGLSIMLMFCFYVSKWQNVLLNHSALFLCIIDTIHTSSNNILGANLFVRGINAKEIAVFF